METLKDIILTKSLGEDGLPVLARMGKDPGPEYFHTLISELRLLCDLLKDHQVIDKELSYALYCLEHYPTVEYSAHANRGVEFREDLFDPQIFELEMAVESVFLGEWLPYLNE